MQPKFQNKILLSKEKRVVRLIASLKILYLSIPLHLYITSHTLYSVFNTTLQV
jgi:hypothetical protein